MFVLPLVVPIGYIYLRDGDDYENDLTPMKLSLKPMKTAVEDASEIYAVTGTNGADNGVDRLIDLMADNDQAFYRSSREMAAQALRGLLVPMTWFS